jgi:hypothetical protein
MPILAPEQVLQYVAELAKAGVLWSAVGRRGAGPTCHCEATDLAPVGDALAECVRALVPAGDGGHPLILGAFGAGLLLGALAVCTLGALLQPAGRTQPAGPEPAVAEPADPARPRRAGGRALGNLRFVADSVTGA